MTARRNVDADDEQVVILRDALNAPPVRTTAPASVFALGRAPDRKETRPRSCAPDPRSLTVIDIPAPKKRTNPPSAWAAVFASMPPGKALQPLTQAQAAAFCAWGRQHGHKLRRAPIAGDTYAVWLAPTHPAPSRKSEPPRGSVRGFRDDDRAAGRMNATPRPPSDSAS